MSEEQPCQVSEATLALRDRVALELGRCVLMYQFIEARLKVLVPLSSLEGTADSMLDAEALHRDRVADAAPHTLGMLVRALKETVFQVEASVPIEQPNVQWSVEATESDVASVRWSFRVLLTPENKQIWEDMLDKLVAERNRLVHHFYPGKLQWSSEQSLREAIAELQAALGFAKQQSIEIDGLVEQLMARRQESAALLDSPEFVAEFERRWLCETVTVKILEQSLAESTDTEGWLPLATAGHRVHANPQAVEELEKSKERYGLKSLRDFAKACGRFELRGEQNSSGGPVFYRRVAAMQSE